MSSHLEIFKRYRELERLRRVKMSQLMEEYDRTVHRPALEALRNECVAVGHRPGRLHNNGLGWSWRCCANCGARTEITGPDEDPPR